MFQNVCIYILYLIKYENATNNVIIVFILGVIPKIRHTTY